MQDTDIQHTLRDNGINLTIDEVKTIQALLKRPPTLSECLLWSIQASEHCSYKSTRHLLKTLPTDGPEVILGPKEDAGIIHLATDHQGHRWGIAVSHESHNHPSQIVPFEGAATGVGGNVRDVCCMGADIIALADGLRFGAIDRAKTQWIESGVVDGIAQYGNVLGIPNIAGDCYYHPGFNDNCLVTVVSLGLIREDQIIHSYVPENADGYDLILIGKPTDRSGFGGASFASADLDEADAEQNRGAVQEPNAFLGRVLIQATQLLFEKLRDMDLIDQVAFKDLGAGGIACATLEIADSAGFGANVCLDHVHVSEEGLHPAVILCSETQERYLWACPPELTPMILKHYHEDFPLPDISEGAGASLIGKVTAKPDYHVEYKGETLVHAKAADITQGIQYQRPHTPGPKKQPEALWDNAEALLCDPNIQDQVNIYKHYDKQVQGRTILERGEADAGVLAPFIYEQYPDEIKQVGVSLALAANPYLGDAFTTSQAAVAEAVLKNIAVGARPIALSDCLCFGNPERPHEMQALVDAIRGLKEAAETLSVPIVGGNVSLYNETDAPIPPSPMISCTGRVDDIAHIRRRHFSALGAKVFALTSPVENIDWTMMQTMIEQRALPCSGIATVAHGGLVATIDRMETDTMTMQWSITPELNAQEVGLVIALTDTQYVQWAPYLSHAKTIGVTA